MCRTCRMGRAKRNPSWAEMGFASLYPTYGLRISSEESATDETTASAQCAAIRQIQPRRRGDVAASRGGVQAGRAIRGLAGRHRGAGGGRRRRARLAHRRAGRNRQDAACPIPQGEARRRAAGDGGADRHRRAERPGADHPLLLPVRADRARRREPLRRRQVRQRLSPDEAADHRRDFHGPGRSHRRHGCAAAKGARRPAPVRRRAGRHGRRFPAASPGHPAARLAGAGGARLSAARSPSTPTRSRTCR